MICPRNVEHQTRRPATQKEGKRATLEAKLGIITQKHRGKKAANPPEMRDRKGTSDIGSG
jgi:hypothetical protein